MQDRAMEAPAPDMQEILAAVATFHGGEREQGRAMLLALWDKFLPRGEPLQLCAIAHYLADSEAEVADELEWDLRALEAATGSREADDAVSCRVPESFLASLHLNVGDCYRRTGDVERARRHAIAGSHRVGGLSDDPYGSLIAGGLRRLQERLATS